MIAKYFQVAVVYKWLENRLLEFCFDRFPYFRSQHQDFFRAVVVVSVLIEFIWLTNAEY